MNKETKEILQRAISDVGNGGIRKKKKSRLNLVQFFYLMTQKKTERQEQAI